MSDIVALAEARSSFNQIISFWLLFHSFKLTLELLNSPFEKFCLAHLCSLQSYVNPFLNLDLTCVEYEFETKLASLAQTKLL